MAGLVEASMPRPVLMLVPVLGSLSHKLPVLAWNAIS